MCSAAATVVLAAVPLARAEVVTMAPHERSFTSPIGVFTVGNRGESVNRIAPLNAVGTTREAMLSNTAYARIGGAATGTLTVGYHVGCSVNFQNGVLGVTPNFYLNDVVPDQNGVLPRPQDYIAPLVTATLQPGQLAEVKVGDKAVNPGPEAQVITRDFHLVVNGCTGPLSIRQYTTLQLKSPLVDDSGAVFGDPTWL